MFRNLSTLNNSITAITKVFILTAKILVRPAFAREVWKQQVSDETVRFFQGRQSQVHYMRRRQQRRAASSVLPTDKQQFRMQSPILRRLLDWIASLLFFFLVFISCSSCKRILVSLLILNNVWNFCIEQKYLP